MNNEQNTNTMTNDTLTQALDHITELSTSALKETVEQLEWRILTGWVNYADRPSNRLLIQAMKDEIESRID